MSTKQIIILSLIVCLPLLLLGWFGVRLTEDAQTVVRENMRELLAEQLRETDQTIVAHFQRLETELLDLTEVSGYSRDALRELIRGKSKVSQIFVLSADGRMRHPDVSQPLNGSEKEFLARAQSFLQDKDLIRIGSSTSASRDRQVAGSTGRLESSASQTTDHGWYVWFWERGVHLIFWRRDSAGGIVAVELVRPRWMADLIVVLPQTPFDESQSANSRIRLTDSNDNIVYQWGGLEPAVDDDPFVIEPLSAPLSSWRLKYFVADSRLDALSGRSAFFSLFTALGALVVCVVGLAFYFYRESSRELREAATRVNFVNQVSHELKTPLTNIRMYAELLEHDFEAMGGKAAGKPSSRLRVILAESGRLSRLIGNVLTFSSQQRHQVKLKYRVAVIDTVIEDVLRYFEPTLGQKSIEVEFRAGASEPAEFDVDAVEQIFVNLFSNVEKYAADGGVLQIQSCQSMDRATITISDNGPGISPADREKIFQPFYRAADPLEAAAGAGIGLSISRSLARLHGGDIELVSSESGASFRVVISTLAVKHQNRPAENG